MSWVNGLQDWLLGNAGQWWTYALTGLLTWVDGFFPPLPSESIVIAMASMGVHGEKGVNLWLLMPLVFAAAWLGDNTAYLVGRLVPLEKLLRGPRGQRMLGRAHDMLHSKPTIVLLTARFIPIYRVAINMTAGALRLPWRRFAAIDVLSAAVWSSFCILVGSAAGALFRGHPLLGILVGVALGFALGWVIDKVATRLRGV